MKNINGKAVNFRPTLFLALSVMAGIFSAYCFSLGKTAEGIITLSVVFIILCVFIVFYSKGKLKRNLIFSILAIMAFVLSYFNFTVRYNAFQSADLGGTTLTVTGRVCKYGKTDYGTKYVLDSVVFSDYSDGATDYRLSLYLDCEEKYVDIGDIVTFTGYVTDNPAVYTGSFSMYNVAESIKYSCIVNTGDIIVIKNSKTVFESINVGIREQLESSMDTDSFRIAYALITGNSGEMDREVTNNFRYAGVGHIFAVSGLHIGFVAVILGFILKKLRVNGLIALIITGTVLTLYSGVCLFTSSSVRATIMTVILLFSQVVRKKYDGLSSVSFACMAVLALSPMQMFDAGFILSFGVVTGALLLYRHICRPLRFLPKKIAETVAFAITAQLIAIPLSIVLFGGFSSVSVIVNIVLVPLVGILFIILFVALFIGWIFGIGFYTLFVPDKIFIALNALIKAFDYSVFYVGGIALGAGVLLYFSSVVIYSGIINIKKTVRVVLSVALLFVFLLNTVLYNYHIYDSLKITAVGNDYINFTLVSDNGNQTLIINDAVRGIHSSLDNALSDYGERIDTAIFPNGKGADLSNLVTGLRRYGIRNVYFSRERTSLSAQQLSKMFPDVDFYELNEGTVITAGKTEITVKGEFSLTEIKRQGDGGIIAVLSNGADDAVYGEMSEYEILIVSGQPAKASIKAKAEKVVSYRFEPSFENAESRGGYNYRKK